MSIFKAVWSHDTVEESEFLYREKNDQLLKLTKRLQAIPIEIEALRTYRMKTRMPDLKMLEKIVLDKAKVIFTTLMTGASGKLKNRMQQGVDYLIIDEAC